MNDENKNCLLCGATSEKKTSLLWECLRCGLLFKNPGLFLEFKDEKARYQTHNNDLSDQSYLGYLNKLWKKIPNPQGEVLDFGCGPSKGLEALVGQSTGKNLEKQTGLKINVDSYDPIFFKDVDFKKKYDVVYASECLEHAFDPQKTFEVLVSFLKPGGVLAISTVLSDGVDLNSWWYLKDSTHVVFYARKTFERVEQEFGLKLMHLQSPHIVFKKPED